MYNLRILAPVIVFTLSATPALAVDFTWKGGGTTSILDPTNWVGGAVPPNDGTSINLPASDRILFAVANLTIPNDGGRQINVANGAQIVVNVGAGNAPIGATIDARINIAGNGTDGNGAIYVNNAGWGRPQNIALTANASITSTGQRSRTDGAANRLDLAGHTLTINGNNESNFVGTNIVGGAGSTIISNQLMGMEGTTRVDPNVTVQMAPNQTLTSWGGQNHRRDAQIRLGNNSAIEARHEDRDLTFTGTITAGAGDSAILRALIQGGVDQRLNIIGNLTGAGSFRQQGAGTVSLSGTNTHTGGTTLEGTGALSAVLVGSNTAFGTGPVTVANPSTVHISNAGGIETRDTFPGGTGATDAATAPVPAGSTVVNPFLTGLHSTQAFDNTRFTYTGTINNTSGGNLVYTFAKQYDDGGYLVIDGTPLISDGTFNAVATGQITLTPGEHTFRASVFNGAGGAGPNTGWNKGIGISTSMALGAATTNNADYAELGDAMEIYQATNRSVSNAFILNSDLTLTTNHMNGYNATVSGVLSGIGNLAVSGSTAFTTDQLILSGTNTYTGNTSVAAGGSLRVTGIHTSTSLYTVAAGAALSYEGVLNVGDIAAPAASADLALTNDGTFSFSSSAAINLDLHANMPGAGGAASENDEIIAGGLVSITLGGTLNVLNPNGISNWAQGDTWDLFDWNTAPVGTFNTVNLPALGGGLQWNSSDLYTGGTIAIVPEPGTTLLGLASTLLLSRRRRH